jgi:hypothetical protein
MNTIKKIAPKDDKYVVKYINYIFDKEYSNLPEYVDREKFKEYFYNCCVNELKELIITDRTIGPFINFPIICFSAASFDVNTDYFVDVLMKYPVPYKVLLFYDDDNLIDKSRFKDDYDYFDDLA